MDGLGPAAGQPSRRNSAEWFDAGLRDWDISRDEPYFGFEIPGENGKYFYVWLDAPIGYLGSLLNYCRRTGRDFDRYWKPDSDAEVYHFIGKDIVYFHTLFWPAVLQGAGFRPPTSVFAHGFLTVNGQKMSKSRGTLISARAWLEHLPAEYLRYFYASRLGSGIDDFDLNLDDFVAKVNSDIVGKLVNIASRCAGFIARGHGGRLAARLPDVALHDEFISAGERVAAAYEQRDLAAAVREIMALTDKANLYIDQQKPWLMAKDPARAAEVQGVCTQGLNLFRVLALYLKPVMPRLAAGAEKFLCLPDQTWADAGNVLLNAMIAPYEPLATRVDAAAIESAARRFGGNSEAYRGAAARCARDRKDKGTKTKRNRNGNGNGNAEAGVCRDARGPAVDRRVLQASTCASHVSNPPNWSMAPTSC